MRAGLLGKYCATAGRVGRAPASSCAAALTASPYTLLCPLQISGLWILLGISIGVALAWILVVKLWEDAQRRRGKLAWANAQATKAVDAMPKDDSK